MNVVIAISTMTIIIVTERVEIRACVFDYKSIQHTSCLDQRVYVTMSSVH